MKAVFRFIRKTFFNTAAVYMLTSCFYFIAFFAAEAEDKADYGAIELFLNSLLFAFLTALIFSIFGALKKIPAPIRYCAEFVLTYGAFYFSLFSLTENASNFPALFAMSTVFVAVYAGASAIVLSSTKKEKSEKSAEQYRSIYESTDTSSDNR